MSLHWNVILGGGGRTSPTEDVTANFPFESLNGSQIANFQSFVVRARLGQLFLVVLLRPPQWGRFRMVDANFFRRRTPPPHFETAISRYLAREM